MNLSDLVLAFGAVVASFISIAASVSCTFDVSGLTLDLTDLSTVEIQTAYKQWTFLMFFCQNNLKCNSEDVMALQDNGGSCTSYLAQWPSGGVTPTYSASQDGTWTFSFSNGGSSSCSSNRKLTVKFICSTSVCKNKTKP